MTFPGRRRKVCQLDMSQAAPASKENKNGVIKRAGCEAAGVRGSATRVGRAMFQDKSLSSRMHPVF